MAAYVAGPSGSGDTHTTKAISGGKKVAKKAPAKKVAKKAAMPPKGMGT